MEKTGFTLIELLGVIVILGILIILVSPPIINNIRNANNEIDKSNITLLYSDADTYIKNNLNDYNLSNGNTICISIDELISTGVINEEIIVGENVNKTLNLIFTVDSNKRLDYELKLYETCSK